MNSCHYSEIDVIKSRAIGRRARLFGKPQREQCICIGALNLKPSMPTYRSPQVLDVVGRW